MHEKPKFGAVNAQTVLHPAVLVLLVVSVLLVIFLPRKYAIAPFLLFAFFVPSHEQIVISGFRVFALRIVILAGCGRMLACKILGHPRLLASGFNTLDKVFFLWAGFRMLAVILYYREMPAVINQVSFAWDIVASYVLVRFLIRDKGTVLTTIRVLGLLAGSLGVCMLYERLTGNDVFAILGGLRGAQDLRNGYFRAQGPFQHEILAGVFGATLVPLFLWAWRNKSRVVAAAGVVGSTLMVVSSGASTAVVAYAAGLFAYGLWPIRHRMRRIRWALVVTLVGLQLVMKAPVWFVINHAAIVGGSQGYHRAELVDQFIRHFWEWCLIGTDSATTWGWDMWDAANQYVAEGEVGGLATLICFIAIITVAFKFVGRARRRVKGRREEWFFWLLGAAVFAHVVAYFGVSYYDQTRIAWLVLLAIISATAVPVLRGRTGGQKQQGNQESSANRPMAPVFASAGNAPGRSEEYGMAGARTSQRLSRIN